MKDLPVENFLQKKYQPLGIGGPFADTLGDVPRYFTLYIHGLPGSGKTELLVQLAKCLCDFGKVRWVSFEQGHGKDLQDALKRNNMSLKSGQLIVTDPWQDRDESKTTCQQVDEKMSKRGSGDFWIIDSLDHADFSTADYKYLSRKYRGKKTLIWIGHSKGKNPATALGEKCREDVQISIVVSKFIAQVEKNRFGSWAPYVIYDAKARELNPLFFARPQKPKRIKTKRSKK